MAFHLILVVALTILGLQRLAELVYARRTARTLVANGAKAVRPDGYAFIVAVHVVFFAACLGEAFFAPWVGLGPWTYVGAFAFFVGEGLRYWSMYELGPRWNTRVYVLPHAPLVARGPYRLLRHPIYLGVSLELAGFALAFGLWATLAGVTALNLLALRNRMQIEDRAIRGTA